MGLKTVLPVQEVQGVRRSRGWLKKGNNGAEARSLFAGLDSDQELKRNRNRAGAGRGWTLKHRPQQAWIARFMRRETAVGVGLRSSGVKTRGQQQDGQHDQRRPGRQ